jgi:hypothetical protein
MKKYSWIAALVLALAMAFVFAGCGGGTSDDGEDSGSANIGDGEGLENKEIDDPQFTGYGDLSGAKNSFDFKRTNYGCGISFDISDYQEYSKVKVYYTLTKLGTVNTDKPMKIGFKIKQWGGNSDTYSGNSGYKESNTDVSLDFEMNIALLTDKKIFIEHNTYVSSDDQGGGSTDFTITITKLEFTK